MERYREMDLLSISRRTLRAADIAMTVCWRYFLHMAVCCTIGIGLLYLGLFLDNPALIVVAVLLQIPFWIFATILLTQSTAILAVMIPVVFYFYFIAPLDEPINSAPKVGKTPDKPIE